MPKCPVCEREHTRSLAPFRCRGCQTELRMAPSTSWAMVLLPLPFIVAALLLMPWIGRAGVVLTTIVVGHLLPWVGYVAFYDLEPASTRLDL